MALLNSELARIKFELGFNLLAVGAEPYIGVTQLFEQVIQPFLAGGSATTSATAIVAASPAAVAAITLASATGFSAGDRVVIDVEDAQEITTVRSISGSVISVFLSKAHPANYPVSVEGGEIIVREILGELRKYSEPRGLISKAATSAGLKKVDEIEFKDKDSLSRSRELRELQSYWRDQLSGALNVPNMWAEHGGEGSTIAVY